MVAHLVIVAVRDVHHLARVPHKPGNRPLQRHSAIPMRIAESALGQNQQQPDWVQTNRIFSPELFARVGRHRPELLALHIDQIHGGRLALDQGRALLGDGEDDRVEAMVR